jgi:hypothetical protein
MWFVICIEEEYRIGNYEEGRSQQYQEFIYIGNDSSEFVIANDSQEIIAQLS